LPIRTLVLSPVEDTDSWLKFASLCRRSDRMNLARRTLINMLGYDPAERPSQPLPISNPKVTYAYIKHSWSAAKTRQEQQVVFDSLKKFVPHIKDEPSLQARLYQKLGKWQQELENLEEVKLIFIPS
jgi:FKBP12-rapamycin complex-associated protein